MSEYLSKTAREKLHLSDQERIRDIQTGYWISYPSAKSVIERLEYLLNHPQINRMPCLLIVSDTNNGKSSIIAKINAMYPRDNNPDGDRISVPILSVQAPASAREGDFYDVILRSLNAPFRESNSDSRKYGLVLDYCKSLNIGLFTMDEFHNINTAKLDLQRRFLNMLKNLNNDLKRPIVGVGTREAFRAIQSSEEVANRFVPFVIPLWRDDLEYQRLLLSFERKIPLRKPSCLGEKNLSLKILSLSEGRIGEIYRLLSEAAIFAIKSGEERITLKIIGEVSGSSPVERKKLARW